MSRMHIADAEDDFVAVNITPDFCDVNGKVVPFDISRDFTHEKSDYAHDLRARGNYVLHEGSIVEGVVGNLGAGIISGVSLEGGNVLMTQGSSTVHVGKKPICRHGDLCHMNVKA